MIARLAARRRRRSPTAIDAERAFAADAQTHRPVDRLPQIRRPRRGDVHARRPVWAHDFLKDRKDPPSRGLLVAGAELCRLRRPHRGQHRPVGRATGGKSRRLFHHRLAAQTDGSWQWIYDAGDALDGRAAERRRHQAAAPRARQAPGAPIIAAAAADANRRARRPRTMAAASRPTGRSAGTGRSTRTASRHFRA